MKFQQQPTRTWGHKLAEAIGVFIVGAGFAFMLVWGLDRQLEIEEQQALRYQQQVQEGAAE